MDQQRYVNLSNAVEEEKAENDDDDNSFQSDPDFKDCSSEEVKQSKQNKIVIEHDSFDKFANGARAHTEFGGFQVADLESKLKT